MRRLALLALALFAVVPVVAQEHQHGAGTGATAGTIQKKKGPSINIGIGNGKRVSFPSLQGNASAYMAMPTDRAAKHPAIIVIQEWWGLNGWVMEQADRFAKQGYVALAVDLYRGKVATDADMAHELMRGMPEDRANADLQAGFNYLAGRADVDASRIGVIGWCMGGGYALNVAIAEPRLAAAAINYGHLASDPATLAKIHAPILGNFGALDRGIPAEDVKAFDAALRRSGKSSDVKIYDGAGHAFMNPNNKEGYVKTAAEDAWTRIDAFFARTLKP